MRLWSLHPKYLDAKGLVALWREGLLAKKVLEGKTKGYRHHPQLIRFKEASDPVLFIHTYLHAVVDEAEKRNYAFDRTKLSKSRTSSRLRVKAGQVQYEWVHLLKKLKKRDPEKRKVLRDIKKPSLHPLFRTQKGGIEKWEITE